jgi:BirA family biotin operon repressor/biotin-[acetyl-CoA-carboxylase] ligase
VVIGVGLNLAVGADVRAQIDQPVASLGEACAIAPSRNAVAAALLESLAATLAEFQTRGFAGFVPEWRALDALEDREVSLVLPDRSVVGIARGVDANGLLQIEHGGRLEGFIAGHVRLVGKA